MNQPMIWITAPVLVAGSAVYFSAYGFGWGYRAFAISYEAVHETLGARNTTDEQVHVAFQLGKRQIIDAVLRLESPSYEGQRILLTLQSAPRSTASESQSPMTGQDEEPGLPQEEASRSDNASPGGSEPVHLTPDA